MAANVAAVSVKLCSLADRLSRLTATSHETPLTVERHSNVVEIYKRKVADLRSVLTSDHVVRDEAISALRGLIDKVIAYPAAKRGQFDLELHGQIVASMNLGKYGNSGGAGSLERIRLQTQFPDKQRIYREFLRILHMRSPTRPSNVLR